MLEETRVERAICKCQYNICLAPLSVYSGEYICYKSTFVTGEQVSAVLMAKGVIK